MKLILLAALALGCIPIAHADDDLLVGSTSALVMGGTGYPDPSPKYLSTVGRLFLDPLGYSGTPTALNTPEQDTGESVTQGTAILVAEVESRWQAGGFSVTNPLTVFGYSQSADIAGLAEPQLAAYGIPSGALRFVMIGDVASAHGGYDNTAPPATLAPNLIGNITPNNLYPTVVYTITGDVWADYPHASWDGYLVHVEYLGLTPAEIANATSTVEGLTTYFTIPEPGWDALFTAWFNVF